MIDSHVKLLDRNLKTKQQQQKNISDWNEVDSAAQLSDMERSKHKFNLIMQQERYN